MLYSLSGRVSLKKDNFFVLETGGIGFKVFTTAQILKNLPSANSEVKIFTSFQVKENAFEVYGFLTERELNFFELLNGVNGVGPKSALNIMNVDAIERLIAAISEGKPDLLTKASGIGKKTAERVVLELEGKINQVGSRQITELMESDTDIVEALTNLGYKRNQAKEALSKVDSKITKLEERTKAALKILKNV